MLPNKVLFDDFFDDFKPVKSSGVMMCDIYEEDDSYHFAIDMPGFTKDDILVECDKGTLKITAEKNIEENSNKKYVRKERKCYQKCERSFYLGDIEEENINAEFKDGVLNIVVPKVKEQSSKKIVTIN